MTTQQKNYYSGTPEPNTPWWKKVWFWIVGAAALTAGAIGIIKTTDNKTSNIDTATVSNIDTSFISKPVYGLNGQIAFSPQNFSSNQLCDSLKALGITEIRVPGGSIAAYYHANIQFLLNLKNLVTRAPIKVIYVANVISSSLSEQLQILKQADSLGIKIEIVEFGNELTNGSNPGRITFNKSGIEYGTLCAVWATEIRKILPNVKFACWLENKPGIKDWVSGTLSKFTPDYAVNHFYPNAKDVAPNGIIDTALLHQWVLKAIYNAGVSQITIPIAATEFNMGAQDLNLLKPGEREKAVVYMLNLFTQLKFQHIILHNIDGESGVFRITKDSVQFTALGNAYRNYLQSVK